MNEWDYLVSLLNYDPLTGVFTWKTRKAVCLKIGDVAGSVYNNGYRMMKIGEKRYTASRLAWFFVYGQWPKNEIDHKNGIRDDNRISNLRDVTSRTNLINSHKHRNGKPIGTCYHKDNKKRPWQARIRLDGKPTSIGYFATEQEAHAAYMTAYNEAEKQGVEQIQTIVDNNSV